MNPTCELNEKGLRWYRTGHPWVYRDDLAAAAGDHGDIVRVTARGRTLGTAFLSTHSKIALRWIERSESPAEPVEAFWRARLEAALRARSTLEARTSALRIVHDAADGFPGLIIDRYQTTAVLQTTTPGSERLLPLWTSLAREVLGARCVVTRNDVAVRSKEGLPEETRVLHGECVPPLWVHEDGPHGRVEFPVDPLGGQKTGAYLDQRENRWRTGELARGRCLDAFSYGGLFSLHLARAAEEVVAVDGSEDAVAACRLAAARAGAAGGGERIHPLRQNVFDYLKEAKGKSERFQTIVLDPPAFAKSRRELPAALRGYKEINRRAMELLDTGGVLVSCSCSYNLSEEMFLEVLREAAGDAHCEFTVLERRGQASDHPVVLRHPESAYLKCVLLRKTS
jgi:23S rRNA (cytosine1962-C5)-methyltransferase